MYKNDDKKLLKPEIHEYEMRLSYKIYKCYKDKDIWDFSSCKYYQMTLLKCEGRIHMFKMKGHTFTMGTGNQTYSRPKYIVGILSAYDNKTFYKWFMIEYDRGTAKKAKEVAEEKYKFLIEREISQTS